MGAGNPNWLRGHTDEEIQAIAQEMFERAEQFSAEARSLMNDELRRRKLPIISYGTSRH
jgi:hypothetical protein